MATKNLSVFLVELKPACRRSSVKRWCFASVAAVFSVFDPLDVGVSKRQLWDAGVPKGKKFENEFFRIEKLPVHHLPQAHPASRKAHTARQNPLCEQLPKSSEKIAYAQNSENLSESEEGTNIK